MRLVGASKTVIQLPFILEGVIAAVIGAALASGTLWAVAHFFSASSCPSSIRTRRSFPRPRR